MTLIDDSTDTLSPVIEHHVDEVLDARGRRQQFYNYIDYHFDDDDGYVRARMYLDKPNVVDVYGPLRSRTSAEPVQAVALLNAAKAYLQRRFNRVRTGPHP